MVVIKSHQLHINNLLRIKINLDDESKHQNLLVAELFLFCCDETEFLLEGAGVAGIPWMLPGGSVTRLNRENI